MILRTGTLFHNQWTGLLAGKKAEISHLPRKSLISHTAVIREILAKSHVKRCIKKEF